MTDIERLPFNTDLGYPQKQTVSINGVAYTIYIRWNPEDGGFAVVKIVRNLDQLIVCNTRIENLTPVRAVDPVTSILQFMLFPYLISSTTCTIWVFHD